MDKNEIRVTDASGGQKGDKLAQSHSIPTEVLLELFEHYGQGNRKYPDTGNTPNYAKGYKWSLSYNSAIRHLLQFWGGEDNDPETGSKHVIAAAWHCLCLAYFMIAHRDKDNRWENPGSRSTSYLEELDREQNEITGMRLRPLTTDEEVDRAVTKPDLELGFLI